MVRFSTFLLALVSALSPSADSWASLGVRHTLREVAARSDAVFVGRVVALRSELDTADRPWTLYTFAVDEVLVGEIAGGSISLRCIGGSVGGQAMRVIGIPLFGVGDEALLFVSENNHPLCQVSGWELGTFRVAKTEGTDISVLVSEKGGAVAGLGNDDAVITKVKLKQSTNRAVPPPKSEDGALPDNGPAADVKTLVEEFRQFARKHATRARLVRSTTTVVGEHPQTPTPSAPPEVH